MENSKNIKKNIITIDIENSGIWTMNIPKKASQSTRA